MDPRIAALKSTTFLGRRFTRRQIADIAETVELFPNDSRNELSKTICENLNWTTPKGGVPCCGGPASSRAPRGVRDPGPACVAQHGREVGTQADRPCAGV